MRLIDRHAAAFRYDWRARFGLPLTAVFDGTMSYAEAWSLTTCLIGDPSSHVGAAVAAWAHPWSREAFILVDLYDLTALAHTDRKKRSRLKTYPRPDGNREQHRSKPPTVSQAEIRAALRARGHGRDDPDLAHLAEHLR